MEAAVPPHIVSGDRTRPAARYALLALLLVIAGGYQAFLARDVFRSILHPESVYDLPFIVDPASGTVEPANSPLPEGLRAGDHLLAIDGVPYTGTHVFDEALFRHHPTGTLKIAVRGSDTSDQGGKRIVTVPLTTLKMTGRNQPALIATRLILYVLMPCFAVALGFWVAAVRSQDALAWILLGVMLGFSQLLGSSTGHWGTGIRDVARAYHLLAGNFWPIGMLLFGLYFPEPFPLENRVWWKRLKWAVILLMVACALPDIVVKTVDVEQYTAVKSLSVLSPRLDTANLLLATLAVTVFFAAVFVKGSLAVSPDAKRRLRLLYFGSAVALTPVFVALLVGLMKGTSDMGSFLPEWLLFTILSLLFLFPLTLAYTIVVQRALDVHVVIRQGLQYALARNGVRALGIAFSFVLGWATVYFIQNSNTGSPLFYATIAAAVVAGLGFRRFGDWLRGWTDRHFFRDAYNAEQILSELSDNVRSIRDRESLLETISRRIAESLHVPQVAALMNGSGPYRAAYALGYSELPQVTFPESAATIRQLNEIREPTRVYLDDPNSWVYRRPGMSEEERRQLQQLGSELLLPISTQEHLLGFVSLSHKRSEAPYSSADLRLLKSVSIQTGLALENASLAATVAHQIAEREKLGRELEIAREVQQRLFPQKLPAITGLDYFGACRPALGVGGDYYDFLALPDGRLGIALGDVSGKGIAAALMMASLQASLRAEAMRASGDLAQMICAVNRLLFDASTSNRYATFFYAEYDPASSTLTYVNAGHNPPMLFRKQETGQQLVRLEEGGTVLGLIEHFPFTQDSLQLKRGDLLVLYTDGISEAMNQEDEEWGEDAMVTTIGAARARSAEQIIRSLITAADQFSGGAPQHDDMTAVVLKLDGN